MTVNRWAYSLLSIESKAQPAAAGQAWTWSSTATLGQRGTLVARWKAERIGDFENGVPCAWEPDAINRGEYGKTVYGPIDHLGDLGWELVAVTVEASAVVSGTYYGWMAQSSVPLKFSYTFKRPQQ